MTEQYNLYFIEDRERGYPLIPERVIELRRAAKVPKGALSLEERRREAEERTAATMRIKQASPLGHFISAVEQIDPTDIVSLAHDLPSGSVLYERMPQDELNKRAFVELAS